MQNPYKIIHSGFEICLCAEKYAILVQINHENSQFLAHFWTQSSQAEMQANTSKFCYTESQ